MRRFSLAFLFLGLIFAAMPADAQTTNGVISGIISDAQGNTISPPLQVDLAVPETGGQYARTIIKTADPDRYGITPGDYLI